MGVASQVVENLVRLRQRAAWQRRPSPWNEELASGNWLKQLRSSRASGVSHGTGACHLIWKSCLRRSVNLPRKFELRAWTGRKKRGTRRIHREPSRHETASGHDVMHMGMMLEVLSPGMQDAEEADICSEVPGSRATSSSVAHWCGRADRRAAACSGARARRTRAAE